MTKCTGNSPRVHTDSEGWSRNTAANISKLKSANCTGLAELGILIWTRPMLKSSRMKQDRYPSKNTQRTAPSRGLFVLAAAGPGNRLGVPGAMRFGILISD